ncbi:MAG: ferritin family protein [Phycisphaerales bacterium]|jgi:rubrerythrin
MKEFSCDTEIFEFVISKEVEAYYFYLALARYVRDRNISMMFEDLAKEELEHKAKMELELMKTGKTVSTAQPEPRPDMDYILADKLPLDLDYKDVLLLGMEKEEAAFRTYVNLTSSIYNAESREVLMAIAQEEVRHKLRFEEEYNSLPDKAD